ncbi:MAG: glycosyltransferase family 39 protein [Nitrososphaerota archaeon]|nr:glycosyltransferase family 39 protein [Nitrososphaerota archaeon]MDG6971223.1 glycosyltransferase family 39 protein [Nitrososphaerota archaeon]MDG6981468.1 glycosyltransferase family 39 protein [Nitrososphaerota archaeon]MDG7015037.1 glycosyltransferase family 39 protein [Nitrososphaerota archaeon]WGO50989.1 MAG: glycosyltransferase family 39 protein [Nitrososphaerota archaeon]
MSEVDRGGAPHQRGMRAIILSEPIALALLTILAALTRLYRLGDFPYFPAQPPWVGSTAYPGLYTDEGARLSEIALFPHSLTTYEPSIQILLVKISQFLIAQSYFADRLPSALASILTAVVVYLAAKQLYGGRVPPLVAGLYFVTMVPALIYGRMIFYENLVGLFLAIVILSVAKSEGAGGVKWIYIGALASLLAVFSKEDGLFIPMFFTLWVSSRKESRGRLLSLAVVWVPMILAGIVILGLTGSLSAFVSQWGFGTTGRELSFDFMVIQALPSAYDVVAGGYFKPEFWYIFAYVCLAALVLARSKAGLILSEVMVLYFVLQVAIWGMSPYEVISVFPILAIAVGGGVGYLAKLGTPGGLAVYGALYAPLVASLVNSIALTYVGGVWVNYPLSLFKYALFVIPIADWLMLSRLSGKNKAKDISLVKVVLVCFMGLLILGTPWLYSYYFLGTTI